MNDLSTAMGIILANIQNILTFNELKHLCLNCGIDDNEIINIFQGSFHDKKRPSKTDLISKIKIVYEKNNLEVKTTILNCFLEKIVNLNKVNIEELKKDLIRFGYQFYISKYGINFIILKKLFDIDNINNYPNEIKDLFIEAIYSLQNRDYKNAITKFVTCIETLANKYNENYSNSIETKLQNMLEVLYTLKKTDKDNNFEINLKKYASNISLILSRYRNFASNSHPPRFEPDLEDVLIVKNLTEFILLLYNKGLKELH